MNKYNSIVPSEMTRKELITICGEIQTSKAWHLNNAIVKLANNQDYKVPTSRHQDYREELKRFEL